MPVHSWMNPRQNSGLPMTAWTTCVNVAPLRLILANQPCRRNFFAKNVSNFPSAFLGDSIQRKSLSWSSYKVFSEDRRMAEALASVGVLSPVPFPESDVCGRRVWLGLWSGSASSSSSPRFPNINIFCASWARKRECDGPLTYRATPRMKPDSTWTTKVHTIIQPILWWALFS